MSQYVSECIKMYAEWIVEMFCARNYHKSTFVTLKWAKIGEFGVINSTFTSRCSKCIKMHQNASKCMQNELCKGFVHKSIKELVLITFKGAKIDEIHFPLYGGSSCKWDLADFDKIGSHQFILGVRQLVFICEVLWI